MTDVPLSSPAIPLVTPTGPELLYGVIPGSPDQDVKMTAASIAALAGTPAPVVLTGSVTGNAYVYLIANAAHLKTYKVIFVGWEDVGRSYSLPTPFGSFAALLQNSSPPCSVSTTVLTIPDNHTGPAMNSVVEIGGA